MASLSPASLIYHQWISHNPLIPPLLIVMYKIRCKLQFFQSVSPSIEVLLPSNCCQFGSNKLIKILTGLDISYVDICKENSDKNSTGADGHQHAYPASWSLPPAAVNLRFGTSSQKQDLGGTRLTETGCIKVKTLS